MTDQPRTVVAIACKDDLAAVMAAAIARAVADDATLVVYAVDAAGTFSSVRPTWWSADCPRVHGALTPVQLEMLGAHDLALAVHRARQAGLDSYGWIPEQRGASGMTRFARESRTDVVVAGRTNAALAGRLAPAPVVTA